MKRGLKNRLRDGEAFDRLVEEHYDDVLAYCRRHAPSYDDAPDVAQEAFLRFVRSGRSPRDGKPLAYLFTIARNLCIDAARARRLPVGPLDVDVPDGSPDADPAMAIGGGEVDALVDALPPELRDVVELRFGERVVGIGRLGQDGGGGRGQGARYLVTTAAGTRLACRAVVNAAGVHADELHNQVSADAMTIVPRRGDYFLLDHAAGDHVRHTVFQLPGKYGKGVLVTPTVHGNLLIGPTATDIDDKEDTATTAAELDEVRAKAGRAVKDLPLRQTITSFAGLRAHELRHEFFIGEAAPGFVDCAGIESPGLSASPAIGAMVARIVSERLGLEKDPGFDPVRKGILDPKTLPFAERAALIREQPAYGQIICRCESITEGEILDAIHRAPGARSLDGVKRRTRAGMGRCQAGFCSPRVLEILARELGVPQAAVTKSGGGSQLIVGVNKDSL